MARGEVVASKPVELHDERADAVGVTLEALRILDYFPAGDDPEQIAELLTAAYGELLNHDVQERIAPGDLYVQPDLNPSVTPHGVAALFNNGNRQPGPLPLTPAGYKRYHDLFVPEHLRGATPDEQTLNSGLDIYSIRAMQNVLNPSNGINPRLHFFDLAYDRFDTLNSSETTQLGQLRDAQRDFNTNPKNQGLVLETVNAPGLVVLALQDLIKGERRVNTEDEQQKTAPKPGETRH
jgi:hypothetical protein